MKKESCVLYIVRHGQTEWSQKNLVQGHTDIPLAKAGEIQARARADFFKETPFDHVVSSDLIRAKQTAQILVDGRNLEVQISQALREQFWGNWEGHSFNRPLA